HETPASHQEQDGGGLEVLHHRQGARGWEREISGRICRHVPPAVWLGRRVQSSFGPPAPEIDGDLRNFTDLTPIVPIREGVVENSARSVASKPDRSRLVATQVR